MIMGGLSPLKGNNLRLILGLGSCNHVLNLFLARLLVIIRDGAYNYRSRLIGAHLQK